MNLWKGILTCFLLSATVALQAQQTTIYTEANLAYRRGVDFFNQNIYGLAQKEFKSALEYLRPVNEPEWKAVKTEAELYYAKCAVRLGQPEAEKLALDFLRLNTPSAVASQAALEIGDYYFNQKEYDKAITYYEMAPSGSGSARDEIQFKKGYSYFITKRFPQAKAEFAPLKDNTGSEWYYPANYYSGCCSFFEGKYDEAAKSFQRCEQNEKYKSAVPYYIAQIYANKKQYDQVITYGAPKAQDPNVKNRPELNLIVGQAYYEKNDYKKALPYLEYAVTNGANLRPSDYYQLGYAQYRSGFYKEAALNLEQLDKQDSLLGQNALYHLGDCYLKSGNKLKAHTAFGQAASLSYDKTVQEDALINYAKLSYELKMDRAAIESLQKFQPSSKYYNESQKLLGMVLLNTRDYDRAVGILENVKNRTPEINAAYQEVTFNRGIQLYQNGQKEEARRYFDKSQDAPVDKRLSTLCSFWMGSIANEAEEWAISKQHMGAFIGNAKNYNDLPEESSLMMGQYIQGYNHLKLGDHKMALANFKAAVDGIKKNSSRIQSEQITKGVLGDAVLRAGDCHFKNKNYAEALAYYNEAVNKKYEGFEYALYQKAIIRGLQGSQLDKAVALDDLIEKYPNSRYTDEALLELGNTYLEMGKLGDATVPLRKLITDFRGKSPLINQAYMQLGLISFRQGKYDVAADYYKQVFANNPDAAEAKEAQSALKETYDEWGRPNDYITFIGTIPGYKVSQGSKDSIVYQSAEYQYQNKRYQQAVDGFTNYLDQFPNGPNAVAAHYYRAESYATDALKKYNLAYKDYTTVVGRGPGKWYARSAERAALLALNSEKNPTQALEYARKWEDAASNDGSRFQAQLVAMEAAYKSGNNAVAVNEYANKVNQSPQASPEQLALSNFYLGKLAFDKEEYNKAYPLLEATTENTTTEAMAESYHLMAQILYRQKKYSDVEELITTRANKNSGGYDDWIARNLILLSDVYYDQGDKSSAAVALEAVLENYKGGDAGILNTAKQKYNKLNAENPDKPKTEKTEKGGNFLEMEGGN
ncbi:MAG TPA: tetratricopeptide repeat protein [Saprospiraceae bacterium]|nr:tetratricopeptide repeat protein [Saprospiraceae bacterium]